jgi:hypothetical protein
MRQSLSPHDSEAPHFDQLLKDIKLYKISYLVTSLIVQQTKFKNTGTRLIVFKRIII